MWNKVNTMNVDDDDDDGDDDDVDDDDQNHFDHSMLQLHFLHHISFFFSMILQMKFLEDRVSILFVLFQQYFEATERINRSLELSSDISIEHTKSLVSGAFLKCGTSVSVTVEFG